MSDRHEPGTLIGIARNPHSGVEGKTIGLHSTVFSRDSNDENRPLNNKNQGKKAEKRPQLREVG